jgi:hypothetical protein
MLRFDSTPAPYSRALAVRADNPTSGNPAFGKVHVAWTDRHDGPLPEKLDPAISGAGNEPFVQSSSAQPNANTRRKIAGDGCIFLSETYAPKPNAIRRADIHPQISKRRDRFRHQSFTAGFFDWRRRAVGQSYIKAYLTSGNRCG